MARFTIAFSLLLAALVHAAPIMLNPPCLGEGCGLAQVKARHEGHDYPVADPPSGNTGASATGAPVPVSTPAAPNPVPSSPSSPSNPPPPPSVPSTPPTPSAPSTPSTPEEEECEEGEEEPEAPSVPAPTGSIPTRPGTPTPTPPTKPETPADPEYPTQPETPTGTDPKPPAKPETPVPSTTPKAPNAPGGGFLRQNGEQAQKENTEFASLTKDSPCTDGDSACVEGAFGQCLGGKWVLQQCANGLTCAALPLVNKQGTSVTCTTEADRDARITSALQG